MMLRRLLPLLLLTLAFAIPSSVVLSADAPRPPAQPAAGPGGSAYQYSGVEAVRVGEPPSGAWLFLPRGAELNTDVESLPLVVFLHGFTALDPAVYRSWIDHLVKRGAAVVYPDYQSIDPFGTPESEMLPNAVAGIRAAMRSAERGGTGIDGRAMALVGHSLGGVLAVAIAATAEAEGLPEPVVLMPVNPGGCRGCGGPFPERGVPLPDLASTPAEVLVAVVVSEDDDVVGALPALTIWRGLTSIPNERRNFVVIRSDRHGSPNLVADHNAPQTGAIWFAPREDALDWYGAWKQFDLLVACGFERVGCSDALGNTPLQRSMGVWSDGRLVRELRIVVDPLRPDDAS